MNASGRASSSVEAKAARGGGAGEPRRDVWVFHRGALGDSVLLWPMLRAMVKRGQAVTFASDVSKASLAEKEIGVRAVNAEQRRFNDLWVTGAHKEQGRIVATPRVSRVMSLMHVQGKEKTWADNAAAMFPGAELEYVEEQLDRRVAMSLAEREGARTKDVKLRLRSDDAPVVLHVGAGSRGKRWPMGLWAELRELLAERCKDVMVLAGDVEMEQFSQKERDLLSQLHGKHPKDLPALSSVLKHARLVVAADCGPAHLSSQLGVPTVALFGPTVAERWAPIGPRVRVIAPSTPSAMDWLRVDRVMEEVVAELDALDGLAR